MSHTDKTTATADGGTAGIDEDLGTDLASAALDLARRFAAGATMWCVAPRWTEHARHVAVEFVHPVIVGKRALPAVFVDAARSDRRAADRVGRRGRAGVPRQRRRDRCHRPAAPCRGLGADDRLDRRRPRPPAGVAHHVVWADEPRAPRRPPRRLGRQAVPPAVGAHPRLLRTPGRGRAARRRRRAGVHHVLRRGTAGGGARGRTRRTGERALGRGTETVDTALVAPVAVGDLVLVHAGTAIAVVAEEP